MARRILPSITTLGSTASSWRDKLREVGELGLSAVALFVTALTPRQRAECFAELSKLRVRHCFTIPFVHAVGDMQEWDIVY